MLCLQNIELIEQEMGVAAEARWHPESANWQSATQYMKIREYQLAVDRLEGLVVSRLLELQRQTSLERVSNLFYENMTKMKISGATTGYKQRKAIGKAIKTQSKALDTALRKYNTLAASFTPPRQQLTMKTVQEFGHLSEFELLRESCREDVTQKAWAQEGNREGNREMTQCQLRLARAREEIVRLDVEVQRTLAFMADDLKARENVTRVLERENRNLARVLETETDLLRSVYSKVRIDLSKLYCLQGYSGALRVGVAVNALPKSVGDIGTRGGDPPSVQSTVDDDDDEAGDESNETLQVHFALLTVLENSTVQYSNE